MIYSEFVQHIKTFLWRNGDIELDAHIDDLIKMGEATLRARLRVHKREQVAVVEFTDGTYIIPASQNSDVRAVNTSIGEHKYITPQRMNQLQQTHPYTLEPVYTLQVPTVGTGIAVTLNIQGPSTISGRITIYTDVPDFKELNQSWLADDHLDLYTYAVCQHVSMFLREDERAALWAQTYEKLVTDFTDDDAIHGPMENAGISLPLPYPASPLRHRGYHSR